MRKNVIVYRFFVSIVYCPGSGLELLSAWSDKAVCQDSKVLRVRKFPLSITSAASKSIA